MENTDSQLSMMSACIWTDSELTTEVKLLRKKWFIRNGQDCDKAQNYEKPVMYLVVRKGSRVTLTYGPVFQVGYSPYKSKMVPKMALLFLCLNDAGNII